MQSTKIEKKRKKKVPDIDKVNVLYVDIAGPTDMDPGNSAG